MKVIKNYFRRLEEQRLIASFTSRRDEPAFRKLYQQYTPRIYQLALRLLGGKSDEAQEVVQDTWVRAVQRLATFRWESNFSTWLHAIAIRRCQEQFRFRARQDNHLTMDMVEDEASKTPTESLETLDLEAAIVQLPDGYRQVLILHDVEGYTHAEIAELRGITSGSSKSQLFHARKAIRQFLQSEFAAQKGDSDVQKEAE